MSLSISSSETPVTHTPKHPPVKFTWRHALGVFLLFLVIMEAVSRLFLYRISIDYSKFALYPAHVTQLTAQQGLRIALIGNSTTYKCTDPLVIQKELEAKLHRPVSVDTFAADGSFITTWYYIFNHYFWQPGRQPDLYIVTFYNDGPQNGLADGEQIEIGRMAQFFTTPKDWPKVFHDDIHNTADQIDFALSSGSSSYAARDRFKLRALTLLIPNYKNFRTKMNVVAFSHQQQSELHTLSPTSYTVLQRLLDKGHAENSHICFVAYPTQICLQSPYPIDPRALQLIRESGAQFVDMRQVPQLTKSNYEDRIHIAKPWAPVYSRQLADAIVSVCQSEPERTLHQGN